MDYRRAGVSRQPEQCRCWSVRSSWSWLQQLRSRAELLCASSVLRRSRGLLPQRCSQLLRSGRSGLRRSGSGLLRSHADLLPGPGLLRSLQQLLQAEKVQEELVQGLQARLQEEPLLPDQLLRPGPDLCRSGRVLLPLVDTNELPGVS